LGFDQEIPHRSAFSKNRHGRFQESKLFEQLVEEIVKQCVEVGAEGAILPFKASGPKAQQTLMRESRP
jgi:hypothetical protein